jgi:hypothetical protein
MLSRVIGRPSRAKPPASILSPDQHEGSWCLILLLSECLADPSGLEIDTPRGQGYLSQNLQPRNELRRCKREFC